MDPDRAAQSLGAATTVATEIPTGYVGDRVGRLRTLAVGSGLIAGALCGLALSESFVVWLLLHPCWSLGWNPRSGSDSAWLYDRLVEAGTPDRFTEVRGRAVADGVVDRCGGYLASFSRPRRVFPPTRPAGGRQYMSPRHEQSPD